jgi:hypothetical protein
MAICYQNGLDGIRDGALVLDDQDPQRRFSFRRPGSARA